MRAEQLPFPAREFTLHHEQSSWTLVCPANQDDVLASISDDVNVPDRHLPYWAEHWPSAEILLRYLLSRNYPPQTRVCEIGAGLGVLSAVLSSRIPMVVSTDISAVSCRFAQFNMLRAGGIPRVVCADWASVALRPRFDLLIGSDVLYEPLLVDPVLSAVTGLLRPGGTALIADPSREAWEPFKTEAARRGMSPRVAEFHIVNCGRTRVEILEVRR